MDDPPNFDSLSPGQLLKVLCESEARSVLAKAKFQMAKAEIIASALRLASFLLVLDDGSIVWRGPPLECWMAHSFIDDDQDWAINVECGLLVTLRAAGHDLTDALQEHYAALADEGRGRLTVTVHRHADKAASQSSA